MYLYNIVFHLQVYDKLSGSKKIAAQKPFHTLYSSPIDVLFSLI